METSEKMLYSLIEKSNDDKNIHEYYYLLDSLQIKIHNKIYNQLNDSLKPKQKRIYHDRATASLEWSNEGLPQMASYSNKTIKLLEEYIKKYPTGKYRYYFADELLTSYSKADKSKVIKVANILLELPESAYNYEGNMFLAMIYHEDKSYQDAINCLNKAITLEQGQAHPIISDIAKEWLKIFRYNKDYPNSIKQKHLFFD
jgi:hypothetical protein